jgi:pyrroloquinoline quinone biosynthesis protein D
VITKLARPRLVGKVRLRFDRHTQQYMLIYPEKGLLLNASAEAIARLCSGENTVDDIVQHLHAANSGATRADVERDVQQFLDALVARALIRFDS